MKLSDLLQLPPGVMLLVAALMWPAIWAGALILTSLGTDLIRNTKRHPPATWRKAA